MSYMRRALELAQQAFGTTSPNPAVGAVLVRDGQVVGEGFTQPAGQAHAEVVAIRQAGELARGATLYVTLEPCCHHGRTPACTQAIIDAQVTEVHFSVVDPNPLVAGKGMAELEKAGIRLVAGEEAEAAKKLNEAYFKFITTGIPFVTAKFAASLDGKIATRTGDTRWITGEAARREAHRLRTTSDSVMVGIGTVQADDPQLTARDSQGHRLPRQPLRIVVDSAGRTPTSSQLLQEPGSVLVAGALIPQERVKALSLAGAQVAQFPDKNGSVDLKALLAYLGQREVTSVLAEGGGALLGSLFDQGLVDKVVAFIAPLIIGGAGATPAVGGLGSATLGEALRLQDVHTEQLGDDIMLVGYPPTAGQKSEQGK
ncbi:MAG: bifunctional diaminohydroxyphosphoribosylaminopyrimidine deaminase/5-amino-6-(5-phosphoribosylamino)uracil reductase RibD [Dehalococcoidia bacterium]|nr:bifunctional diaminohydroxyphosphoribosylaminopyrimidine deaminase/5-amino-6-(5-phosphoribosylamino)uracil reductase RibD [Dehalococcoidia bacterium]